MLLWFMKDGKQLFCVADNPDNGPELSVLNMFPQITAFTSVKEIWRKTTATRF